MKLFPFVCLSSGWCPCLLCVDVCLDSVFNKNRNCGWKNRSFWIKELKVYKAKLNVNMGVLINKRAEVRRCMSHAVMYGVTRASPSEGEVLSGEACCSPSACHRLPVGVCHVPATLITPPRLLKDKWSLASCRIYHLIQRLYSAVHVLSWCAFSSSLWSNCAFVWPV